MNFPYEICTKLAHAVKLEEAEKAVGTWLNAHPRTQIITVVAMHAFRIMETIALMHILPFSLATNCMVALSSKIIYRLSIERCCDFHFVIPSIFATAVYGYAKPAIELIISRKAFETLSHFTFASSGLTLALIMSYTIVSLAFSEVHALRIKTNKVSACCNPT